MKRVLTRTALLVAAGILAVGAVACSSDDTDATEIATATSTGTGSGEEAAVAAVLTEWTIEIDRDSAPAGEVVFNADNQGTIPHELVVIKSDLAEDALPVVDGKVDESQVDVIGEIEEFPAGETVSASLTLKAGNYLLICNVPAHYGQGMHTTFTVE
ncbi:MAG: plastocyanin/azurin family copper-binding protein [Dehalococcoidia bacterium]